jgi:hypothetical protein
MNRNLQAALTTPPHLFSHYSTQSCMEACTQCHQTLMHTVMQYSLPHDTTQFDIELFRLMMNCAELCQTTANFQLSDSKFCRQVATLNAQLCEECAAGCERRGDLEDCVQACRECAECCRNLNCMHS